MIGLNQALFLNGVYRSALDRILGTQTSNPDHPLFLRPKDDRPIVMLRDSPPTPDVPVMLYASTTDDLNMVSYTAEIIRWEDATALSFERVDHVNEVLALHQYPEGLVNIHRPDGLNLLSIRRLAALPEPFSTGKLVKVSDGQPLSAGRKRAGGWSPVYPLGQGPEGE